MLTPVLRGLKLTLAIALAVILSAQLVLHQHSFIPEDGAAPSFPCAICAFGADPAAAVQPLVPFALVLVWTLMATVVTTAASGATLLLPSRAPPVG
jgi:hypothetical protein